MSRASGRAPDELRTLQIIPNTMPFAEGSASIRLGDTHVLCAATIDERVPSWMMGQGKGWVTAEYGMLPRATSTRTQRESSAGRVGGRTQEIQRLIGRSLRAVTRMEELGERTITLDCDVIQADGGTRTASITGAFVSLALAGFLYPVSLALRLTKVGAETASRLSAFVFVGVALSVVNYAAVEAMARGLF